MGHLPRPPPRRNKGRPRRRVQRGKAAAAPEGRCQQSTHAGYCLPLSQDFILQPPLLLVLWAGRRGIGCCPGFRRGPSRRRCRCRPRRGRLGSRAPVGCDSCRRAAAAALAVWRGGQFFLHGRHGARRGCSAVGRNSAAAGRRRLRGHEACAGLQLLLLSSVPCLMPSALLVATKDAPLAGTRESRSPTSERAPAGAREQTQLVMPLL